MPRLKPIEREQAPAEAQAVYDGEEEKYGAALNSTKMFANSLAALRAVKSFISAFNEATAVPLDQKALIRVRVATLNGCPF